MNEQRERPLVLDYECLHSMPNGLREVRVWLDPVLETWLVGKRIDLSEVQDSDLVEPRVMEMINHPNVVTVRSVATIPSYKPPMQVVEVFMPYYELGSITDALLRGERFTAAQSLRIIRAALQGLADMHERYGILHRDVKSPNLFLTGDASTVKIGDLGLAGAMDSMGKAPCVNAPHLYAPPELLIGDGLTRSSDLYSLGVVLLELLRGRFRLRRVHDHRRRRCPPCRSASPTPGRLSFACLGLQVTAKAGPEGHRPRSSAPLSNRPGDERPDRENPHR
ncbi:protein kinase [Streptomyces sp. A10(2020)]|uniref:protein kinase domain-containing protein n=1 Tax=Streptomyces sp. A10(2020) TaxID=2782013 RepID=UPI001F5D8CE3|nr:protein kinase [Streptomyces sp. A10(2020)]UNR57625.1 protein kinase [Streptomyces sp. A10(2020)]